MSTFSDIMSSLRCSWKSYCHYTGPSISSTCTIPDFVSTDDWFTVQCRWVNKGVAHFQRKITESHTRNFTYIHQMDLPRNLIRKHAYQLLPPNSSSITLVHYIRIRKLQLTSPIKKNKNTTRKMCTNKLTLLLYGTFIRCSWKSYCHYTGTN